VPLEILLDSTPLLADGGDTEESFSPPSVHSPVSYLSMGAGERSFSGERADELLEKFRLLLGSPLADGVARIVEESFRLLPIIPPPAASDANRYVSALDVEAPRRGRGRPRIPTPE
jgi:hypothetical protein